MNKKAEGRTSSMFLVALLIPTVLIIIAGLLSNLVLSYGVQDVPQFEEYRDIYEDMTDINEEVVGSQVANMNETTDVTRTEDVVFVKAIKTVIKFPKMMSLLTRIVTRTNKNIGIEIPGEIIFLLTSIITLLVIVLLAKTLWRFRDV